METIQRLGQAIQQGDFLLARELIEKNPYLLARRTDKGVTPLLLAVYYGQDEIVRFILDQECQLDLFEAAAVGKSLRVAEILDAQPELANAYAPDGFTPLGLAAFFGHPTVCEILLARGAEVQPARGQPQPGPAASLGSRQLPGCYRRAAAALWGRPERPPAGRVHPAARGCPKWPGGDGDLAAAPWRRSGPAQRRWENRPRLCPGIR